MHRWCRYKTPYRSQRGRQLCVRVCAFRCACAAVGVAHKRDSGEGSNDTPSRCHLSARCVLLQTLRYDVAGVKIPPPHLISPLARTFKMTSNICRMHTMPLLMGLALSMVPAQKWKMRVQKCKLNQREKNMRVMKKKVQKRKLNQRENTRSHEKETRGKQTE